MRGKELRMNKSAAWIAVVLFVVTTDTVLAKEYKWTDWKYRETDPAKKILFAPYTVQNNILKMTAQFYPLTEKESRKTQLQIKDGKEWKTVAKATISEKPYNNKDKDLQWTAHFRVEKWDSSKTTPYRIVGIDGKATYEGSIRRDPVDKEEIVVAAFTGNNNWDRTPKPDIIDSVKSNDADLLFFSGDQSYCHVNHLDAWLLFGRQFGEIIRDRPTICIPDDHDVGNGNLWGNGGKDWGNWGYHNVPFVKGVENAQTSNLPDPYDPTPIERGIGVYYTSIKIGRVDFAIIEDRKWKTALTILDRNALKAKGVKMSRSDHVKVAPANPREIDVPEAPLLGKRQLKFLDDWGTKWKGVDMKCVLSQTIFAGGAHLHGGENGRLAMDLDSNGWPQSGRERAVRAIRKAFALHIGGDQHLATIIHHGIDEWNDSMYSFCVPSICNYYARWWSPLKLDGKRIESLLPHTGEYLDGFGNRITMHAYVNPSDTRKTYGDGRRKWGRRAAGHGIVRFNVKKRTITMECWPRGVYVKAEDAEQYPGFPIKITQEDNYGRKAKAYLPTLHIKGQTDPVVQVINEGSKEVVYTLRIKGHTFRPKVFKPGKYTVKIGEGKSQKTLRSVEAISLNKKKSIEVNLK